MKKSVGKNSETRSEKTGFQNPAYAGTVVAVAAGACRCRCRRIDAVRQNTTEAGAICRPGLIDLLVSGSFSPLLS